jgi:hypothetical protein
LGTKEQGDPCGEGSGLLAIRNKSEAPFILLPWQELKEKEQNIVGRTGV